MSAICAVSKVSGSGKVYLQNRNVWNVAARLGLISRMEGSFLATRFHSVDHPYIPQAFASHFVALNNYTQPQSSKISLLTHFHNVYGTEVGSALRLFTRTASMACCARIHGDPTIFLNSRCWHTASLNFQRPSGAKTDKD